LIYKIKFTLKVVSFRNTSILILQHVFV